MNGLISLTIALIFTLVLSGCSGSPYRQVYDDELIESRYVIFQVPDTAWEIAKDRTTITEFSGISSHRPGVTYHIGTSNYALKNDPTLFYFDKNSEYLQIHRDDEMNLDDNDREQGISYVRQWVSYVSGIKCTAGVFSRNGGGMMASVNSKNYGISCGYYHKSDGRRLLRVDYRYHYAGGDVRHQQDKDIPRQDLPTLEQAEQDLKLAVKSIVESLQIKDVDWDRMRREGLLHPGTTYELSPY